MSVKDLSDNDFLFWKRYNDKDIACHEEEFIREIDPALMHALYRGYKSKNYKQDLRDPTKLRNHNLAMSKIFTAVNTIVPNLQYQMPRVLVVPENGTDPMNAARTTATLNHYNNVLKQKSENQEAILNSYFMGISWKKVGYHFPSPPKRDTPESQLSPEEAAEAQATNDFDSILMSGDMQDAIRKESPFNSFESPLNVLLDHKGTLRKNQVLTHRLPRTLQDIYDYGLYDPDMIAQMVKEYSDREGSRFDAREVKFTLNEKMIVQRNGIWILVFADEFNKPLYYEKTDWDEFPWYPLVFTNEPGIRYPTSHMSVASRSQQWVDEIASRYVEMIGRARRQHYVNQEVLAPGQKQSLEKNLIGGILFGKRPITEGDIKEINSSAVMPDIQAILAMLGSQTMENLGGDSQRITGKSTNKTLGQDQIAAIGTEVRESGMLDKVRDWMIDQQKCMVKVIQKHSGAQLELSISQNDFKDPKIAQQILGQEKSMPQSFRTPQQPLPLSHFTQNDKYDVIINIYEAVKPDKKALAEEYDNYMLTYSNPLIENALLERGKRVRLDIVAEERAKMFEYIDGDKYIEELDSMQMAAIQTKQMLMSGGMPKPVPQKPKGQEEPKQSTGKNPAPMPKVLQEVA